jgi:HK97 family phage portal protein
MSVRDTLRAGLKGFRWSGIGGQDQASYNVRRRQNLLYWSLPGTQLDYVQKAGDLWKNSIVGICLNWWMLSFPEARCMPQRLHPDGETVEWLPMHPLAQLLQRPAPRWGGRRLWKATVLSYLCDGNAYWLKVRANNGRPVELRWVPHFQMEPRWPSDGSAEVTHYEQYVDGSWIKHPVEDVVHFRFGVDPDCVRKGLSPLKQQLRQVFSDNEYSTVISALIENFMMTPFVIGPRESGISGLDDDEAARFTRALRARTTGDRRGEPIFMAEPFEIEKLGFSPDQMAVQVLNNQWTSRVCAALMLDPMVVGLPSETNTHYDNREQAESGAWYNGVLPVMAELSEELDLQLLPDFERDQSVQMWFDTRNVRALQPDEDARAKRLVLAAGGPIITPNEARLHLDLDPVPDGDELRSKGPDLSQFAQGVPDAAEAAGRSKAAKAVDSSDDGSDDQPSREPVDWAERVIREIEALDAVGA